MSNTESTPQQASLTVALGTPSARVLADQATVIQDLEFTMDCCKRLLTALATPEADRDAVAPVALWSAAVVAYARCFGPDGRSGLSVEDVQSLTLQGAVLNFHEWILEERDKLTEHPPEPLEAAKVGAALTPPGGKDRKIEGIAVFSHSRVLVDATGARQLGGLASELAKQTALKAQKQQDVVLADAKQLDIGALYEAPPLPVQPPD